MPDSKILLAFGLFLLCVRIRSSSPYYPDYGNNNNYCEDELDEIKTSIKDLENLMTAVGKAADKNFKWEPTREESDAHGCPTGFTFLPEVGSCYKVVYENHNWDSAAGKCRKLDGKAHLVTMETRAENDAVTTFLRSDFAKNTRINVCHLTFRSSRLKFVWTSGRRTADHCYNSFVWKESTTSRIPFNYTRWASTEPNCQNSKEHCMHIDSNRNYLWNDTPCTDLLCPLCEYEPQEAKPTEAEPEEPEPTEVEPEEPEPTEAEPEEPEPTEAEPEEPEPTDAEPEEAEPTEAEPDEDESSGQEP